ncbi:RNA-directed DNA polymerase, eukaryota [Tanacetum coccineum]
MKKSGMPRTGGSILSVMEEVVKVGQTMGYNMEGCVKDITEIIKSQGVPGGVWTQTGSDLMIVVVYAPQAANEKRMLWDYLTHVSSQWVGEIVMMGDFNEVRNSSERFGSIFKPRDAEVFNSFIRDAGLIEVHLGGTGMWNYGSNPPFRSINNSLEMNGFDNLVRDAWRDAPGSKNNAIRNLIYKLKFTKDRIRGWLSCYRLNMRGGLDSLKEDLRKMDETIDKGINSDDMVRDRLDILNRIQHINNAQRSEMSQKAKIKWVVEGDENSKFYHGMLNKKRSQSNIRGIMVNGRWIDNPASVKHEFLEHFRCRFDKPPDNRARIDMNFPNQLSDDQRDDLESMVTKEEVKGAVWDCGTDKSPGPDGFSFCFYRHFWTFIQDDVFEVVDFFKHGVIPNGCNSNFIALIPKIHGVNMVKDYRPISLIGSFYKIIAKILSNRLVNVIGNLVNEIQSAFVAERQILDGPFILNEVLSWCRKKKKNAFIFKVDFEKAYDSVRGFSRRRLIPTEEFQFFKGLKQANIYRAMEANLTIDTLVAGLGLFFSGFTGLRINMCKSKILGINVEASKVQDAANKLGCLILKTPFIYLGTRVGGNMCRKEAWNEVVDKMLSRLSRWKMKTQSIREFEGIESGNILIASVLKVGNGTLLFLDDHMEARSRTEESQYNALLEILQGVILGPTADRFRWELENDGEFSVASVRKLIDDVRFQEIGESTKWLKTVPIKVNVTAWRIKTESLQTRFNLSRRGIDIGSIMCPLCSSGVETTSHLFFQCDMARQLTNKVTSWWNVDRRDVNSFKEWRNWMVAIRIHNKLKGILEGVFYGLWWMVWNFRNKFLFDSKKPYKAVFFDNLVSMSYNWCKFRCKASFKWNDWLKNPYLISF